MKKVLLLLLLPMITSGQKIALINRDFKQPIIYTDSITVQQISSGLFPVSVENFDTLYANLTYIHSMLEVRQRSKMKSFELHSGSTIIAVKSVPFAYGDRYLSIAKTKIGEIESVFYLTRADLSNAKNANRIETLMKYMKANKDLFKAPNDIQPKIYNVIVITE
jgi:hypothetical protein